MVLLQAVRVCINAGAPVDAQQVGICYMDRVCTGCLCQIRKRIY